jgi:hypothetical protein
VAILLLLIGGGYGSSLGFDPEYLCKSSFRLFGRGATITIDTPSGPGLASPIVDDGASSATPWTEFGAVAPVADGGWLPKAVGEVPQATGARTGRPQNHR